MRGTARMVVGLALLVLLVLIVYVLTQMGLGLPIRLR